MNYSLFASGSGKDFDNFPTSIRTHIPERESYLFGASDDLDRVIGYAVFSFGNQPKEMILDYVEILKDYRDSGYSSELLEFAFGVLKNAGVIRVRCAISGTIKDIISKYEYLLTQDFEPVELSGHLTSYQLGTILDNPRLAPLYSRPDEKIKAFSEIGNQQLRSYGNIIAEHGISLNEMNCDEKLSQAYMQGSSVQAGMLIEDNSILGPRIIEMCLPEVKEPLAVPAMLTAAATKMATRYSKDLSICMTIYSDAIYEAFKQLLGTPDRDYFLQSYSREL